MPPSNPPEKHVIVHCLTSIRRRHFGVRLVERITVALQWAALVALFLTGARLLREGLSWESFPFCASFLALIPLAAAVWLFRHSLRFQSLGLSPALVRLGALLTAILAAAMLVLLYVPIGRRIPVEAVPAATVLAFISLAALTVRMINVRTAAIYVDQQAGLRERVSTALELLATPANSPMEAAFHQPVIASALEACQQVRTAKVGYRRLDSRAYALAALVAVAAASLTLVPPMPARAVPLRKPNTILVKKTQDLRQVLAELEEKKLPLDKATPEALKPLQNAITRLQEGNMSAIESSAMLNEAKEQLKQKQDAMAAADKVQDALKAMSQTSDLANAAESLKNAEMQQAQGGAAAGDQQKAASAAIKAAADALANKMASGQMSDGEKMDLADKLQAAADKASADPQLKKDLQAAADAARDGNSQKLSQSLQSAGQRLGGQCAANQMCQGAINRAMSEIDKMQGAGNQSTMGQGNQGNSGNGQGGGGDKPGGDCNSDGGGSQANAGGGQPGSEGGQSGGEGQGSTGQGQGNGSSGGSTMMEGRSGPGDQYEGSDIGKKGTFVRIYESTSVNTAGNQEKVGSFINPLKAPAVGTAEVFGPADQSPSVIKTYADVLPEARQQAMDDLARQEYPPQYQEMVRQFYSGNPK